MMLYWSALIIIHDQKDTWTSTVCCLGAITTRLPLTDGSNEPVGPNERNFRHQRRTDVPNLKQCCYICRLARLLCNGFYARYQQQQPYLFCNACLGLNECFSSGLNPSIKHMVKWVLFSRSPFLQRWDDSVFTERQLDLYRRHCDR